MTERRDATMPRPHLAGNGACWITKAEKEQIAVWIGGRNGN